MESLKKEVYKLLNVKTTKEVKKLYPNLKLNTKSAWQSIIDEYKPSDVSDVMATTNEYYGIMEGYEYAIYTWSDGTFTGMIDDLESEHFAYESTVKNWVKREVKEMMLEGED